MSFESFVPAPSDQPVHAGLMLMTKPDEAAARRLQIVAERAADQHHLTGVQPLGIGSTSR